MASALSLGVMLLSYLVMVNWVLKPRVILEIRSEVAGTEVWHGARCLGLAPAEVDVSRLDYRPLHWSMMLDRNAWINCVSWSGNSLGFVGGLELRLSFCGSWKVGLEPVWGHIGPEHMLTPVVSDLDCVYWTRTRRVTITFREK